MLQKHINFRISLIIKIKLFNKLQVKMETTKTHKIAIIDIILIFLVKLLLNFMEIKKNQNNKKFPQRKTLKKIKN